MEEFFTTIESHYKTAIAISFYVWYLVFTLKNIEININKTVKNGN